MAPKKSRPCYSLIFALINLHVTSTLVCGTSSSSSDASALLKFKESLKDESGALASWSSSTSPCYASRNNWAGIVCSRGGNVWGLRLENMGLSGTIDVDSLTQLPRLRSISFMKNNFGGPLPDFMKLKMLKGIFLAYNNFDGSIPTNAFEGLRRLRKIHLEFNKFNGEIPNSLASLSKLVELNLEGNQFKGAIPDFKFKAPLRVFNVSNNQLQGPLPPGLASYDPSAFAGNKELCGPPLATCSPTVAREDTSATLAPPPTQPSEKHIPIAFIIIGVVIALALALAIILMVLCGKKTSKKDDNNVFGTPPVSNMSKNTVKNDVERGELHNESSQKPSTVGMGGRSKAENANKLSFIRDDRATFDMPDLLKAAAEILGSGCFGSSYKATLNDGSAVVVKRFKKMNNVGREEFTEHMRRLGRLSHPNLLPLVAYYFRKEEKLFITDPISKGSLAVLLHGQTRGKATLDWPTRLKVIKGAARGLSYLYKELNCLIAPHGHLKSSNVLLNDSYEPILSDYGLIPLINQENVQEMMVAYKSPEYFNNGRITKKTDVWALGILIVETLTGKFPSSYLQQGSEVDMTTWVQTVVDEGFDKNMGLTKNSEGEMHKLLNIGIACCKNNIDERMDIKEACVKIEEVKERDNDDEYYSTYASTQPDVHTFI